jgi:hypothetical protein
MLGIDGQLREPGAADQLMRYALEWLRTGIDAELRLGCFAGKPKPNAFIWTKKNDILLPPKRRHRWNKLRSM